MENLWKKEPNGVDGLYIDLFKTIERDFNNETNKWSEYLQALKIKHSLALPKNNKKSSDLMWEAGEIFQQKHFHHAMDIYTRALSFAEPDSDNASMALANRAACFFHIEMYDRSLRDIELALAVNCTAEIEQSLEKLKNNCQKMMKSCVSELPEAKLNVTTDTDFPGLENLLTIISNNQFGRHFIAKSDIAVGQLVLIEENFASVAKCDEQMTCYTCLTEIANFIACSRCSDVVFCSKNCMEVNLVHKFDCNTLYHELHCKAKFTIQTIMIAVEAFSNIDDLITFVEDSLSTDALPDSINDLHAKYRLYLQLKNQSLNASVILDVYKLFSSIMMIPSIQQIFNTEHKQRFLKHLILHHLAINVINATESELSASIGIIFSLFNHSCAPNLYNYSVNNRKFCVTIRPVKMGEQLFINYLSLDNDQPTDKRQNVLKSKWGFECKCDKCEPRCRSIDSDKMKSDSCYKFIHRNSKTDSVDVINTSILKKKCIKFLTKYGHLPFSDELKFISDIYTNLI